MDSTPDVTEPERSPFTVRLPSEVFASLYEEIEPIFRADGRKLRRYRMRLAPDMILTETPMDQPLHVEDFTVQPMEIPASLIFYTKNKFGAKE